MTELDIGALKRLDKSLNRDLSPNHRITVGMVRSQLPAIIAALEDRDRLRRSYDECVADASRMSARLDELEEDHERLRAALIAYGDHIQPLCPALSGGLCDCGWTLEAAALIPEGRND